MTSLYTLRNKAILVGLLFGLTLACGKTSPANTNTDRIGGAGGGGGKASSGGQSGNQAANGGTGGGASNTGGVSAQGGTVGAGGAGGGATDTAPTTEEDAKVDVAVEDVLPPPDVPGCTDTCNIGRKRCSNDRIQECVMVATCPKWQDAPACTAPMLCSQSGNNAVCACPTSCTAGRKRCEGGMLEECGMTDGCPAWKNPTACAAPTTCTPAGNTASCACPAGACDNGAKRCQAGALQECKPATAGACPSWQPLMTCAANKECTDPAGNTPADCRCKPVCTAGQKKCVAGNLEECVAVDGCPAWKTNPCANGTTCLGVGNNASCTCPAGLCKVGDKQCLGTGIVQVCQAGPGGCGNFVNEGACSNGRVCTKGPDVGGKTTASCDCPAGSCTAGEQRCDSMGVHQTCEATGGRCGVFVNDICDPPKSCTANRQGGAGACNCPANSCDVGSKKCVDNKVQTCGGSCGQTVTVSDDCVAKGQTCKVEGGVAKCVATCTPGLCTINAGKCEGSKAFKCEGTVACPTWTEIKTCNGATPTCNAMPVGPNPPAGAVCCPDSPCVAGCGTNFFRKCKFTGGCFVIDTDTKCEAATPKCDQTKGCVP